MYIASYFAVKCTIILLNRSYEIKHKLCTLLLLACDLHFLACIPLRVAIFDNYVYRRICLLDYIWFSSLECIISSRWHAVKHLQVPYNAKPYNNYRMQSKYGIFVKEESFNGKEIFNLLKYIAY